MASTMVGVLSRIPTGSSSRRRMTSPYDAPSIASMTRPRVLYPTFE